ncbi:MAG: radical SAM protein [Blautia sp.]|nr:radical SAM protein [Lachnoclostridium sp.]MCM1212192.1 radical SAM protein [Blautia sp.]
MEKNGKIVLYCDVISANWVKELEKRIARDFPAESGYALEVTAIVGKGSFKEAAARREEIFSEETVAVAMLIGVKDCCKSGKSFDDVLPCLEKLRKKAEDTQTRLILMSVGVTDGQEGVREYNRELLQYARQNQIRLADVYEYRKRENLHLSMRSGQNARAIKSAVDAVFPVLTRTKLLVLWQFNGRYAHCNYSCPYCYVATSVNKGMHFNYDMETWEKAFERHFQNQNVVFYFSYGEPMMAGNIFYEALEMIGRHPLWEVRMTSNVSLPMDRLMDTRVAREGRLNINASFHPTQITIDKFLEKCDEIRAHGIEPSIIYVMYPEQIDDLEGYIAAFRKRGYRVHIRAFRGLYKGKKYPQAYTKEQWIKTAKYMDRGNFKYQLHAVNGLGRMSMLGMSHILVDNYGKIEMCDSYVGDRHYGNIFDEKIYLDVKPYPFPGLVPLAAVDDIADYTEIGYTELEENNVNCFNTQGGVVKQKDGSIVYPYEHLDLRDKKLVRELKRVPKPFKPAYRFWLDPVWICQHFLYSFVIKKYGKYIWAWCRGKWSLYKQGKLQLKNFWHS